MTYSKHLICKYWQSLNVMNLLRPIRDCVLYSPISLYLFGDTKNRLMMSMQYYYIFLHKHVWWEGMQPVRCNWAHKAQRAPRRKKCFSALKSFLFFTSYSACKLNKNKRWWAFTYFTSITCLIMSVIWYRVLVPINISNKVIHSRSATLDAEVSNKHKKLKC